jgi:hypothetical protein
MVTNTEARATAKQLWYLHILTRQDTREWLISMKEASDMITVLKGQKIEQKQKKNGSHNTAPALKPEPITQPVNDDNNTVDDFLATLAGANVSSTRGA